MHQLFSFCDSSAFLLTSDSSYRCFHLFVSPLTVWGLPPLLDVLLRDLLTGMCVFPLAIEVTVRLTVLAIFSDSAMSYYGLLKVVLKVLGSLERLEYALGTFQRVFVQMFVFNTKVLF